MELEGDQVVFRRAQENDRDGVFDLSKRFATSFTLKRPDFDGAFRKLLTAESTCLLVAAQLRDELIGYLLGLEHPTFFANGSVAHVEEIMVSERFRNKGIGSALMKSFENWAIDRECKLVTVATRRAPGFYKALHFEESAVYFRKILSGQGRRPITGVPGREDTTLSSAGMVDPSLVLVGRRRGCSRTSGSS